MSELEIEAITISKVSPPFPNDDTDSQFDKENCIPNSSSNRRLAESMLSFLQRQTKSQIERVMKRQINPVSENDKSKCKNHKVIQPYHEKVSSIHRPAESESQKKELRSTYQHVSYSPVRQAYNDRTYTDIPPLQPNLNISRVRCSYEGSINNVNHELTKENEAQSKDDYFRTRFNHIMHTEKQKFEQEKKVLEAKINDLMYQIANQKDQIGSISAPDKNLLERNAYLSSEVDKLRTQHDIVINENQRLISDLRQQKSSAPTTNEIELHRKVADLEFKLDQATRSSYNSELQIQNKNLKEELTDCALK